MVSPDGRSFFALTEIPPESVAPCTAAALAERLRDFVLGSVAGATEVRTRRIELDGAEAVRLTYVADDPTSGTPRSRSVTQIVTVRDDVGFVLTFVVATDAAELWGEDIRRIERSWHWGE